MGRSSRSFVSRLECGNRLLSMRAHSSCVPINWARPRERANEAALEWRRWGGRLEPSSHICAPAT